MIKTLSVLVRLGVSKSRIRKWISQECIFKIAEPGKKLSMEDTFSPAAIQIRSAFVLDADFDNLPQIANCLNKKLGFDDKNLQKLMDERSITTNDLIKEISKECDLPISWRKFDHFK